MQITKTLYVDNRADWRKWLSENGDTETEIWLVYPRKLSGRVRIPYNDAVEEALCLGWIDSIEKSLDEQNSAQRFTPRKSRSNWSELNKERARRMIASGKMTESGSAKLCDLSVDNFKIAPDILQALQADETTYNNFQHFPDYYKRIRIGFIEEVRKQPEVFQKRLSNFVRMTAQNKKFGTIL